MNLRTLVEKAPMPRKMISFAAQRLMELKVESQSGAAYGEKTPERLAQRNGYAAFGSFIVRKNQRIGRNPKATSGDRLQGIPHHEAAGQWSRFQHQSPSGWAL